MGNVDVVKKGKNMAHYNTNKEIAFGNESDIFALLSEFQPLIVHDIIINSIGIHRNRDIYFLYISFNNREGKDVFLIPNFIEKYKEVRLIMSRTSESDFHQTSVVQHRHNPYGYNCFIIDNSHRNEIDEKYTNELAIDVDESLYLQLLNDRDLEHALSCLGYPINVLFPGRNYDLDLDEAKRTKFSNENFGLNYAKIGEKLYNSYQAGEVPYPDCNVIKAKVDTFFAINPCFIDSVGIDGDVLGRSTIDSEMLINSYTISLPLKIPVTWAEILVFADFIASVSNFLSPPEIVGFENSGDAIDVIFQF